jgi:hypothetical protein
MLAEPLPHVRLRLEYEIGSRRWLVRTIRGTILIVVITDLLDVLVVESEAALPVLVLGKSG